MTQQESRFELIDRIGTAFDTLRRDGFVAVANFMCCAQCGVNALGRRLERRDRRGRGKHEKGIISYCGQSHDRLMRLGQVSINTCPTPFTCSLSVTEIDHALIRALLRADLQIQWDGDDSKKVRVSLPGHQWNPQADCRVLPEETAEVSQGVSA